jgi:hypothetical protein
VPPHPSLTPAQRPKPIDDVYLNNFTRQKNKNYPLYAKYRDPPKRHKYKKRSNNNIDAAFSKTITTKNLLLILEFILL